MQHSSERRLEAPHSGNRTNRQEAGALLLKRSQQLLVSIALQVQSIVLPIPLLM